MRDEHVSQHDSGQPSATPSARERFLKAYLADLAQDGLRPLSDYLALFPGSEDEIAAEYRWLEADNDAAADTGADADVEPVPAPAATAVGKTIGRYRIVRELGRGGQARVYLAHDPDLAQDVALKVLRTSRLGLSSAGSVQRFRREAELTAHLDHPGICKVLDLGEDREHGLVYIAMRYVGGETLALRIARSAGEASRPLSVVLPPLGDSDPDSDADSGTGSASPESSIGARQSVRRVLELIERVARALHAAHEGGLIHRDIKPGNIIVQDDGEPVILDFGMAREESTEGHSLTSSGDLLGTPYYMSPEQLLAKRVRLDRRTDVYSLGVTLYECLTLRRPFEADSRDALYQLILTEPPPDPVRVNRHLPRELKVLLATALDKNRERRYPTALAFADDLHRLRHAKPIAARRLALPLRVKRWSERNPAAATFVAVLTVALIVTFLLLGQVSSRNVELEAGARAAQLLELQDSNVAGRWSAPRPEFLQGIALEHRGYVWDWLDARSRPPLPIEIPTPGCLVRAVEFHPDAEHLLVVAVAPTGHNLLDVEVQGKVQLLSIEDAGDPVKWECPRRAFAACLAAGGRHVVTGDADSGEILVWDMAARDGPLVHGAVHTSGVLALCVARDGTIASGGMDHRVRIWEAGDLTERELPEFEPQRARIRSLAFDPTGQRLVVGDAAGVARLIDVETGGTIRDITYARIHEEPQGQGLDTRSVCTAAFSPDGKLVALAGENDGRVGIWSADDGALVHELNGQPVLGRGEAGDVAFDPDGRFVVSCGQGIGLVLHSVSSGKVLATLLTRAPRGLIARSWAVAMGPAARRVVVSTGWLNPDATRVGGKLSVWDLADLPLPVELVGHTGDVRGVLVSGDGRHAYTHDDVSVRKWDLRTGAQLFAYRDGWLEPRCFALRPGGRGMPGVGVSQEGPGDSGLAVGGMNGRGVVLDTDTGNVIHEFVLPVDINRPGPEFQNVAIGSVAYTPDGQVLAIGPGSDQIGTDHEAAWPVVLLDADTFEEQRRLHGHRWAARSIVVAPNRLIALGSYAPQQLMIWDLESEDPQPLVSVPGGPGLSIALDPQGVRLFAQTDAHKITVFDPHTGQPVTGAGWTVSEGVLTDLDFHPSGTEVCLTTSIRTTVWDDPPRHRVSTPRFDRLPGDFTARARFVGRAGLLATGRRGLVTYYPVASDSAMYAARRTSWRAARLVREKLDPLAAVDPERARALGVEPDPVRDRWPSVDEVATYLRGEPNLDAEVRGAALSLVEGTSDDSFALMMAAFTLALAPDTDAAGLSRAKRYAGAAVRAAQPDTFQAALYNTNLGFVCWRNGEPEAAIEPLRIGTSLATLRATARCRYSPENFNDAGAVAYAILAMIHSAGGERGAALAEMETAWATGLGGRLDEWFVKQAERALEINVAAAEHAAPRSAMKTAGPPDASRRGRSENAWFRAQTDTGEAALALEYERCVALASLRVFAVGEPCAVARIVAFDADDREYRLWPSEHTTHEGDTYRYGGPEIRTQQIRLVLATSRTEGASGIDTVRLIGPDDKQWPVRAAVH